MPLKPGPQTKPISYDDFHSLDYKAMGIVFNSFAPNGFAF